MALPSVFDSLTSLQGLSKTNVTLTGEWASPDQWNHRTWKGEAVAEVPMVGMVFIRTVDRIYWAKQSHFPTQVTMELMLRPLPDERFFQFMYFLDGFDLGMTATTTAKLKDELPQIPPYRVVQTGEVFTFASLETSPTTELYALFFAKQDAKIARNHIWGLKKRFHANLTPPLLDVLSRGRKGVFLI